MQGKDDVLVPETQETRVYLSSGGCVIFARDKVDFELQKDRPGDEKEVFIAVPTAYLDALIARLIALRSEAGLDL